MVTNAMAATATNQDSIDLVMTLTEEVWNSRDYDRLDDIVSDDFVQHGPVTGMQLSGRGELLENIRLYQEAFSDLESNVDLVFADEDGEYVCAFLTNTGTHDGELMGIPATDVEGTINVSNIHRIENGQIVESWILGDMLGLFTQLGSFPETGPFAA
ncbi:ester cyclase [Haloplanus pelagicus]|uniref:ester cyclase n=1 Tax=Haloplanus pelagicus TaxID=2949995 RepID=UPI00203C64C6|nr:ester cyclase [Haloplanus sp. HW8-1]